MNNTNINNDNDMEFSNIQQLVYKQQQLISQLRIQSDELDQYKEQIDKATQKLKNSNETRKQTDRKSKK